MVDTTPVTREITKLISKGTSEQALLTAVVRLFPELNSAELLWAKAKQETRDVNPGVRECLC